MKLALSIVGILVLLVVAFVALGGQRAVGNRPVSLVTGSIHVFGDAEVVLVDGAHRADSTQGYDDSSRGIPGCRRYEESVLGSEGGEANTQFGLKEAALGRYTVWLRPRQESQEMQVSWMRVLARNSSCEGDSVLTGRLADGWHSMTFTFTAPSKRDSCGVRVGKLARADRPVPWR